MNKLVGFLMVLDSTINAIVVRPLVIILGLLVAGMLALGVFTRAVFEAPLFGLEELVLICAMWLYMLGAGLASRERSHLSADFVQVLTQDPMKIKFMHLVATVISLIMACYFAVWSFDLLTWGIKKQQATPVFHIPWFVSQGSLFVASLMFVAYLLRDVVKDTLRLMGKRV